MSDKWDIPADHKIIYLRGLQGKHVTAENIQYVLQLSVCLQSTLNTQTYEECFHHLLWFEEAAERDSLQKRSVKRVTLKVKDTTSTCFSIMVPGMNKKQRYVRKDDRVLLISLLDPKKRIRAEVKDISNNELIVYLCSKQHSNLSTNFHEEYKLVFLFSNFQYTCMHTAIDGIISSKHKTKLFPKKNITCNKKNPIITWFNTEIARNAEQRAAVEHIVSRTSVPAPYILHGPPGTGKTVTIVEVILQVLRKDPSSKIMVCAPSNSAADNVACKLIKYGSLLSVQVVLLRCNSLNRDWSTFPSCLIKYSNVRIRDNQERKTLSEEMLDLCNDAKDAASVIICTIGNAPHALQSTSFTYLFIDEAAQATEASCLPIIKLLSPDGLLILSGDPLQLGPVITSKHAMQFGFGMPIMERLMKDNLYKRNDPNYTVMLRKNFRSHADILKIPNVQFYNGKLEACAREDVTTKRNIFNKDINCRAIAFYAVYGWEAQEKLSSSYFNVEELQVLKLCIEKLIKGDHKEQPIDIGIITPYISQVYKINTWLNNKGLGEIEVGSVEAYQGREKKIILMSTVRGQGADSQKKVKLGFLADSKRFNVALTRAKSKFIVIGNPNCLQTDKLWRIYIEICKQFGSYYNVTRKQKKEKQYLQKLTTDFGNMVLPKHVVYY